MVAARRLSDFATSAARVLDGPWKTLSWLPPQIEAGYAVLGDCAALADGLPQLSPQTAFKLGAAFNLVFGPGRAAIAATLVASSAGVADAQHAAAHLLPRFCDFQLASIACVMGSLLHPSRQPQAAAAFANSTARPAVLLPWLDVLTRTLSMLHSMRGVPSGDCHKQCVCSQANCFAWRRLYILVCKHDVASSLCAAQASGQLSCSTTSCCCTTCSDKTPGPSTQLPLQPTQPCSRLSLGCSCSSACPLQLR